MSIYEELELVNKAIANIYTGGQSFSLNSGGGSRQTNQADLTRLLNRKKELENQIYANENGLCARAVPGW